MILQSVRWYLAYALSYRNIEEMMKERGIDVDHSTIQRWVVRYSPQLEQVFHAKKKRCYVFLTKAIGRNGKPSLINIDQSGVNTAGIKLFNQDNHKRIKIRQCKYLNNIVEQDHRFIKKLVRATLGFKRFHSAQKTIKGLELIRMLNKGQMKKTLRGGLSTVKQFYALAA